MKPSFLSTTALAAGALLLLAALPVHAHGIAHGGVLAGLAHPLLGPDHLLMLLAVGTAASQLSLQLLLWALGGGVLGAVGGMAGWSGPLLETLAPLAIMAVAALTLLASRRPSSDPTLRLLAGGLVAAAVGIHGLLHGLEAPSGASGLLWWCGALLSPLVIGGGTALLLRRLPKRWGKALALTMLMAGGVLALS